MLCKIKVPGLMWEKEKGRTGRPSWKQKPYFLDSDRKSMIHKFGGTPKEQFERDKAPNTIVDRISTQRQQKLSPVCWALVAPKSSSLSET